MKLFAPNPALPRGPVAPKHLIHRWVNCIQNEQGGDVARTIKILKKYSLADLAYEFDIGIWDPLEPYYDAQQRFQEEGRTGLEITLLGLCYGTVLKAGRIAEENGRGEIQKEVLEIFTENFALLIRKRLRPYDFTLGFAELVENGASLEEISAYSRKETEKLQEWTGSEVLIIPENDSEESGLGTKTIISIVVDGILTVIKLMR